MPKGIPDVIERFEKEERVNSVLARATTLSDELRATLGELEIILQREDSELEPSNQPGKGE